MSTNLVTIYSPEGETFDGITKANARDLVTHCGWTYERVILAATPAPAAPQAPVTEAPADTETTTTEPATFTIRKTVEEFADLTDKDQVKAYLSEAFPTFKIDGRANRDKLVALAVELAEGHAIDEVEAEQTETE